MVVNGSHSIYRGTDEVFSYYLVADVGFVRRQWKNFVEGVKKARSLLVDHRVLKEVLETDPDILGDKKVVLFDQVKRPFNKPLPTPGHVPEQGLFFNGLQEFSINPDHGFAGVKTVAYLALQVSIALGYDQIVYYGLDLGGSRRFYEEESPEKSMIDQDYEQFIEPHFAWGADACRTLGVKVVNASPYSRLPASIFPRVEPGSVEEFLNGRIIARD
ncbi:MAG: hypothetical protein C0616_03130 [Desulfuromonas sp.]|nr:MAG: hypothetical protein C0616_03130 [Desulfuromonas sp.]